MGWRDLLQSKDDFVIAPWTGGRNLWNWEGRRWIIEDKLPPEHGWHKFRIEARKATVQCSQIDPPDNALHDQAVGYLVGDRFVPDDTVPETRFESLARRFDRVHLIEEGLERFARVRVGRFWQRGPLIYGSQEMPLGPEDEVMDAFLDGKDSVDGVKHVQPSLRMAFIFEYWQGELARKRREEEQKRLLEEEQRLEVEERRRQIAEKLGDGAGRREMAAVDFTEAARAALAVGGAQYLDHRVIRRGQEMAVTFRMDGCRYECTCDVRNLRIIDAGICLTDEYSGEKGDAYFTLESLPGVIQQAERQGVLVVFRHV